ncbi:hypothetical protein MC885_007719 [Smutsia gigantea]|nr:hypothetical protein MC885_007719 [Smutsia gigantea]
MIALILKCMEITEYEARIINQMLTSPLDRYCLTTLNYSLTSFQKTASTSVGRIIVLQRGIGLLTSRPSTPIVSTPTPQTMSVSMSLTGQKFTIQFPLHRPQL